MVVPCSYQLSLDDLMTGCARDFFKSGKQIHIYIYIHYVTKHKQVQSRYLLSPLLQSPFDQNPRHAGEGPSGIKFCLQIQGLGFKVLGFRV